MRNWLDNFLNLCTSSASRAHAPGFQSSYGGSSTHRAETAHADKPCCRSAGSGAPTPVQTHLHPFGPFGKTWMFIGTGPGALDLFFGGRSTLRIFVLRERDWCLLVLIQQYALAWRTAWSHTQPCKPCSNEPRGREGRSGGDAGVEARGLKQGCGRVIFQGICAGEERIGSRPAPGTFSPGNILPTNVVRSA